MVGVVRHGVDPFHAVVAGVGEGGRVQQVRHVALAVGAVAAREAAHQLFEEEGSTIIHHLSCLLLLLLLLFPRAAPAAAADTQAVSRSLRLEGIEESHLDKDNAEREKCRVVEITSTMGDRGPMCATCESSRKFISEYLPEAENRKLYRGWMSIRSTSASSCCSSSEGRKGKVAGEGGGGEPARARQRNGDKTKTSALLTAPTAAAEGSAIDITPLSLPGTTIGSSSS